MKNLSETTGTKRINGRAFKLPYYVRLSDRTILEFFAADEKAFVYLPQPKQADIDISSIPKSKCWFIGNYPSAFAEADEFFEILSKDEPELFEWWTTSGQNAVHEKLDKFLNAQNVLREHLGINLPDDWAKLADITAVENLLQKIPVCLLYKIGSALSYVTDSPQDKQLKEKIYDICCAIRDGRPKSLKTPPTVVKMSNIAEKFSEVQTPDGTILEFFTLEDSDKIFVHGAQLAVACGYPNQSGTTSDNSDFGKAVNAVAKFYAIRCSATGKARRFVDVNDVPAILREFYFNRVSRLERYETTVKLLRWWQDGGVTFDKSLKLPETISADSDITETTKITSKAKSPKLPETISVDSDSTETTKITSKAKSPKLPAKTSDDTDGMDLIEKINARADLLMKTFGALRRDALRAAVKLAEQETGRDLSPLLELLN